MKPNAGLNDEQRAGVASILKSALADEYVLYTKTRNFHWNVTGPLFHDLHKFLEGQYAQLEASIDEVAENIRYFGFKAPGTMAEFLETTRLKEARGSENLKAQEMVGALLADHEALIQSLRRDIDTAGSAHQAAEVADFLTGLLEQHLKMAWMLRSMLE